MTDRRSFIKTVPVIGLAPLCGAAVADEELPSQVGLLELSSNDQPYKDRYWEQQWMISEYEQDLADMRNHRAVVKGKWSDFMLSEAGDIKVNPANWKVV